jgi:hypothetical protein
MIDPNERHVMLDLETLGQEVGDVPFALAAVPFDPIVGTLGQPFFALIQPRDALRQGLQIDPGTIAFWNRQNPAAQRYLEAAHTEGRALRDVLEDFSAYLGEVVGPPAQVRLWGKGADFDKPLLGEGYRKCHLPYPWTYQSGRCYRTLEGMAPFPVPRYTSGTAHHALDDAAHQAQQAVRLLRHFWHMPELAQLPALTQDPAARKWVMDPLAPPVTPVPSVPRRRAGPSP